MTYIKPSTAEPVYFRGTTGVTTYTLRIRRDSDGFWYDWSDSTFKAGGSVTTLSQTMTEVDATRAPGLFRVSWPGAAAGDYVALVFNGSTQASEPLTLKVGQLAAPGDAMGLSAGAITSATFAADSITSSAVATSAVTEIQAGLATASALGDVQARLPTALVSGRLPVVVQAMDADVLTASALAASAVTEIASAVGSTTPPTATPM